MQSYEVTSESAKVHLFKLAIYVLPEPFGSEPPSIRAGHAGHHFPHTGCDHDEYVPHLHVRLQLKLAKERVEYVNPKTYTYTSNIIRVTCVCCLLRFLCDHRTGRNQP